MKTQPKIYAIRDKLTGEYCVFGSKCAYGEMIPKSICLCAAHNDSECCCGAWDFHITDNV